MVDYKNTLAIVSLIEVLTEKGVIDNNDIAIKQKPWILSLNIKLNQEQYKKQLKLLFIP